MYKNRPGWHGWIIYLLVLFAVVHMMKFPVTVPSHRMFSELTLSELDVIFNTKVLSNSRNIPSIDYFLADRRLWKRQTILNYPKIVSANSAELIQNYWNDLIDGFDQALTFTRLLLWTKYFTQTLNGLQRTRTVKARFSGKFGNYNFFPLNRDFPPCRYWKMS